jgi:hypothetical protein
MCFTPIVLLVDPRQLKQRFGNIIKSFDKSLVIVTQAQECSQQANI